LIRVRTPTVWNRIAWRPPLIRVRTPTVWNRIAWNLIPTFKEAISQENSNC
jgi:hypothetical protein